MATVDKSANAIVKPAVGLGKFYVMHNYVDFTVAANQLIQTATMALFDVPAYHLCLAVIPYIVTADAHISDVDIGYESGNIDVFCDGITLVATGYLTLGAGTDEAAIKAFAGAALSASDRVIILTNNDAQTIDEAVMHFHALMVDLSDIVTNI